MDVGGGRWGGGTENQPRSLSCYTFQEPGNRNWEINKRFVFVVLQLADCVHCSYVDFTFCVECNLCCLSSEAQSIISRMSGHI